MTAVQATHRPRLPLWAVVAAGGIIAALSLGVRSTFGLLIVPIADGLDTTLGAISLAIAVQNLLWGFSQPIAGALSDRFGAPRVLAAGGVLYIAAMALMSTAQSSGMILLTGGFLTGIAVGAASFAVVLSAVGRMAPPEKRSMMLGVVSAVGSLGQFVLIPVTRILLERSDWQSTSLIMAGILVLIILVAPAMRSTAIAMSDAASEARAADDSTANEAPTLRADLSRAAATPSYLFLNAAFFVCGFHVTFIGIHLAGFVELSRLSPSVASTALALIGLFNVFGSLLVGWLGQRYSFTKLLAGIYGLRAVTIAVFVILPTTGTSTIIFAMVMGVLWLSTVPPTSAIVTQQFGPTNAGALFGVVFLSHQLGSFLGAYLGGEVVDRTGSYATMWWLSIALGIFAMAMHLVLDESPVGPKPPGSRGIGLAPAALVMIVISLGVFAAGKSVAEAAHTADGADGENATYMSYCALGPALPS